MEWLANANLQFRGFWLVVECSSAASFIADVANTWAATGLSMSPSMAGWIQAAPGLSACMLAIPGTMLADAWERRRLMLTVQTLSVVTLTALLMHSVFDQHSTTVLLGLAMLSGACAALMGTTVETFVPGLVPPGLGRPAPSWGALSRDIARTLAALVAGFMLACAGGSATYATALVGAVAALVGMGRLPPVPMAPDSLAEKLIGSLRAELRYARASKDLRHTLRRSGGFFFCAGAGWAMLPLAMRHGAPDEPGLYGLALAGIGAGTAVGRWVLSCGQRRLTADALIGCAGLVMAGTLAALALRPSATVILLLTPLAGTAGVLALILLSRSTRSLFPVWVRGRGRGIYWTAFYGAWAVGSATWGVVGNRVGTDTALVAAAVLLILLTGWGRVRPLPVANHEPSATEAGPKSAPEAD